MAEIPWDWPARYSVPDVPLDSLIVQKNLSFWLAALDARSIDLQVCRDLLRMMLIRSGNLEEQVFSIELANQNPQEPS